MLFSSRNSRTPEETVTALVTELLAKRGLTATPGRDDDGEPYLEVATEAGTHTLMLSRPMYWADMMSRRTLRKQVKRWLDRLFREETLVDPATLSMDALCQRIYPRLVPPQSLRSCDRATTFSYARQPLPDLAMILVLDSPASISWLSDATLSTLPLGVDELYERAMANMWALPAHQRNPGDTCFHILDDDVMSPYLTARVADLKRLVPDAPAGHIFAIPLDALILVAAPRTTEEMIDGVERIAGHVGKILADPDAQVHWPWGSVYYAAPTGEIELLEVSWNCGEFTIEGEAFNAQLHRF